MTLVGVGGRAVYSRGLVTARFGSKDQLLEVLVEQIVGGWSHRNLLPKTDNFNERQAIVIQLNEITLQAKRDPTALRVLHH
jgi:AcrR family transcriptional regulator